MFVMVPLMTPNLAGHRQSQSLEPSYHASTHIPNDISLVHTTVLLLDEAYPTANGSYNPRLGHTIRLCGWFIRCKAFLLHKAY